MKPSLIKIMNKCIYSASFHTPFVTIPYPRQLLICILSLHIIFPFLKLYAKWKLPVFIPCIYVWLASFTHTIILRLILLLWMVHCLSLLRSSNSIVWVYQFVHLDIDGIQIACNLGLWERMLLWTFVYMSLYRHMLSLLWANVLKMSNHMADVNLAIKEII